MTLFAKQIALMTLGKIEIKAYNKRPMLSFLKTKASIGRFDSLRQNGDNEGFIWTFVHYCIC